MLRFYLRFLRQAWALVHESTGRAARITSTLLFALTAFGPWLVAHGQGDLAAWASKVPWWWSPAWVVLFVLYGLAKANYELHSKTQAERDALAATLVAKEASGPKLGVVFDPKCEGCFSARSGVLCLGVWNGGPRAEDVHFYLSDVEPGPTATGKLELSWLGEERMGRPINTTSQRGHHHAILLVGDRDGYYFGANTPSGALGRLTGKYSVEVTVEAGNSDPVTARVMIDSDKEPPVLGVSVVV